MAFGSGQSYTDFGRPTGGTPAALEPFIEVMLRGIVGFRFAITRLEGKWKMSQNRDMKDRDGVVQGLGKRRRSDDLEIAEIVSGLVTSSNLTDGTEPKCRSSASGQGFKKADNKANIVTNLGPRTGRGIRPTSPHRIQPLPALGKIMASDDKKVKTSPAQTEQAPPKSKETSGVDLSKVEGGETAADSPSGYSRGEGQKPVSKAYKDNWNVIFGKKKKR